MTEIEAQPEDDELERVERRLRLVVNLASAAFTLYVIWDYMKDRPQLAVWRARVENFVKINIDKPLEARRKMRKAESEVVFEAIQAVSGDD